MINEFDVSIFTGVPTVDSIKKELRDKFVKRRKELKITQKDLAIKSNVSYASIRRFENEGEISLTSLLKIADAISCLSDFNNVFKEKPLIDIRGEK